MKPLLPILIADDSKEDCYLLKQACQDAKVGNPLAFVHDGVDLLALLRAPGLASLPGLILLDLNMPRMGGKEALRALRSDARLSAIPVIILSTSDLQEEVLACYKLGANAVMAKPPDYEAFVAMMAAIRDYWFKQVELPLA